MGTETTKQQRRVHRYAVKLTVDHDGDPLAANDELLSEIFRGCARQAPTHLYPAIRIEARRLIDTREVSRKVPGETLLSPAA